MPDEILSIRDCMALLKIKSWTTLDLYIKSYKLPYIQIGNGNKKFLRSEVLKWLERFSHPYNKFLRRNHGNKSMYR